MSRRLHLVCLSHLASPGAPTGAESSLALLASGMAGRGHRVTVVAPGPWVLAPDLERAGVAVEVLPCRVCWLTYHDPRPWPVMAWKCLRWALPDPGRRRLRERLASLRPDVVHVNCLPHVAGAAAAAAAGLGVVWHLREILPPGARRRFFARRLGRDARRVVAVSEPVAAWVREEGLADRVSVIHNGIDATAPVPAPDLARRELGLPADGCLVGLFGQILPHKGVLGFVAAAAEACQAEPTLRFVIAGPGPERFVRQVRAAVRAAPGPGRFHVLDAQPSARLLVAAADVVCLTTLTPDPLPRVVLEAMAAERPVVAFRSGGTPEMVAAEQTGLLVESGDFTGLAAALVRLARAPELRRTLGQNGGSRARERFSLGAHVERMEQVLGEVARA